MPQKVILIKLAALNVTKFQVSVAKVMFGKAFLAQVNLKIMKNK